MRFHKYHSWGNVYLVLPAPAWPERLSAESCRRLCHPGLGLGADGIIQARQPAADDAFSVLIFNPDGSEAEKSGNGLRIFAYFLWEQGDVTTGQPIRLVTGSGRATATVAADGRAVSIDLGSATFDSRAIPVAGPRREVIGETLRAGDRDFHFCAVSLGNPHCVILETEATTTLARRYGPAIETHPLFPRRTNVQFISVIDPANLRLVIWERGAGLTLASGSSACAALAVARRLTWCQAAVDVHMPGGVARVTVNPTGRLTLSGPVNAIARGDVEPGLLAGDWPASTIP